MPQPQSIYLRSPVPGSRDQNYLLAVGDATTNPPWLLDAATLYSLARTCMAEAAMLPRDLWTGRQVVCVDLPYSDYDSDQSTPSYGWSVVVEGGTLAEQACNKINTELERTAAFSMTSSYIPAFPDDKYDTTAEPLQTVEAVIADLRVSLLAHQSDSIRGSMDNEDAKAYWSQAGFDEDQIADLVVHFDDGLFDDFNYEDDIGEAIEVYCLKEDQADEILPGLPGLAQTDLFLKLKHWADGRDPADEANTTETA